MKPSRITATALRRINPLNFRADTILNGLVAVILDFRYNAYGSYAIQSRHLANVAKNKLVSAYVHLAL